MGSTVQSLYPWDLWKAVLQSFLKEGSDYVCIIIFLNTVSEFYTGVLY